MTGHISNTPAELLPVLLTESELSSLRSLLDHIAFQEDGFADDAKNLLDVIDSRPIEGPHHDYVLAGPWGTIREGSGTLEETVAGCRDARAQHWATGHGRDERYRQIQVQRYSTFQVTDGDGEELGEFHGEAVVIEVPDSPLTEAEQAESDARDEAQRLRTQALYAHLREGRRAYDPAQAPTP